MSHSTGVGRRRYLGEGFHGEGPLGDQLLPAGEGGEHREQVVPQVPADEDVEVPLDPGHDQGLMEGQMYTSI